MRVEIECSNTNKKKFRKIVFNKDTKKVGNINILDKYFYLNDNIKNINSKFFKNSDSLKLQYKYLLKNKNLKQFKNLSFFQILYQHYLYKLCKKNYS